MDEPHRSSGPDVDERGIKPPPAFAIEELPRRRARCCCASWASSTSPPATVSASASRRRWRPALRNVVLDMADARFIDSSMLKELLRANTATREGGGQLVLTDVQPAVERLLDLTRVREILVFAASRDEALGRASGGAAPG